MQTQNFYGMRKKMSVLIPELHRKFRLLMTYGYAKGFDDLESQIGRKKATIIGWGNDARGREPGTVPTAYAETVLCLLMAPISASLTPAQAKQIVLGSADQFETHLRAGSAPSLRHFIDTEGDSSHCKLIMRDDEDMGLIEITRPVDADGDVYKIMAGQEFRIVIERDLRRHHVLVLQNAQSVWGIVPHSPDQDRHHTLIPGTDDHARPLFMCERNDLGTHLFVVIATPGPIPAEITTLSQEGVTLDSEMRGKLAFHYQNQDARRRKIFALGLEVTQA